MIDFNNLQPFSFGLFDDFGGCLPIRLGFRFFSAQKNSLALARLREDYDL